MGVPSSLLCRPECDRFILFGVSFVFLSARRIIVPSAPRLLTAAVEMPSRKNGSQSSRPIGRRSLCRRLKAGGLVITRHSLPSGYCTAIGPPVPKNALDEMVAAGATFPVAPGANLRIAEPLTT